MLAFFTIIILSEKVFHLDGGLFFHIGGHMSVIFIVVLTATESPLLPHPAQSIGMCMSV